MTIWIRIFGADWRTEITVYWCAVKAKDDTYHSASLKCTSGVDDGDGLE
jgi:hypothetical protein